MADNIQNQSGVVLIVDDSPGNIEYLAELLGARGYRAVAAFDGPTSLIKATQIQPDIILLDVMMPRMDGYETCRLLKSDEHTRDIPVIFMSALGKTEDKIRGFAAGAVDYITKPPQIQETLARIHTHITLRRQQLELRGLYDQEREYLEKLVHMKNALLAMASHDLKNPLSIIQNALQLIQLGNESDKGQKQKYMTMIESSSKQMLNLITGLLDTARTEAILTMTYREVDFNDFLSACVETWRIHSGSKGVVLEFCPDPNAPQISIDPDRMRQAIDNLVSNAIKYTPKGGKVKLTANSNAGESCIQVEDTGFGIPEKDLPHIFDYFYRVDSDEHLAEDGTGFGLSIVKTIVEKHSGAIQVASELGKGTTFSITLPDRDSQR